MSMSAAAVGSNDTAMNSIAQKLVFSGKINSRLKILIGRLIEINYFRRNAALVYITGIDTGRNLHHSLEKLFQVCATAVISIAGCSVDDSSFLTPSSLELCRYLLIRAQGHLALHHRRLLHEGNTRIPQSSPKSYLTRQRLMRAKQMVSLDVDTTCSLSPLAKILCSSM